MCYMLTSLISFKNKEVVEPPWYQQPPCYQGNVRKPEKLMKILILNKKISTSSEQREEL